MAAIELETMQTAWASVARYTVYRTEGYASRRTEVKTILHVEQLLPQAKLKVQEAEILLHAEPGYRPNVMSRALIGMELEKPEATRIAYQALLNTQQAI
jgi:hypothetical protein